MSEGTQAIVEVIEVLARERQTFTSDDIRPLLPEGASVNQIPSAVSRARREGLIREIGRQHSEIPERKGSLIPVFEAGEAIKKHPPTPEQPAGEASAEIEALRACLEQRGYLISNVELATLLLLVASRGWTILAGPSGTGKSIVVRLLAEAFRAAFQDVQVKKHWTSSEEVLGFYSETAKEWVPGPVYTALARAEEKAQLTFVRFDEMNLAPPEYYAAELLSAGESWEMSDGRVVSAPLQLPPVPLDETPMQPRLTNDVLLFGTLNIDETTQPLSPKVLDRSSVVTFESVDLASLPNAAPPDALPSAPELPGLTTLLLSRPRTIAMLGERSDEALLESIIPVLTAIDAYTAPLGYPISYRQRDGIHIALCLWKATAFDGLLPEEAVVDACIRAMMLPKLQGAAPGMAEYLRGIAGILAGDEKPLEGDPGELRERLAVGARYPLSLEKVVSMIERLATLGYFDFW